MMRRLDKLLVMGDDGENQVGEKRHLREEKIIVRPFHSDNVINERISEQYLKAYHIGFDQKRFRLLPLVDVLRNVIPEFALGYHAGTSIPLTSMAEKLKEAANIVYQTDKYQKRGEFGELILHLLLRDFHETIPLVSKIYFKDSPNVPAHGFDSVQISISDNIKKLWLGESKLYKSGISGIKELSCDIKKHLSADFLRREFALISKRLPENTPYIEYWRNFMDSNQRLDTIFNGIVIAMACTYDSDLFKNHNDNTPQYFHDFEEECYKLNNTFLAQKPAIQTEIILLLIPIQSKDALNTELNKRLKGMQSI
jgi:hypothetical protein